MKNYVVAFAVFLLVGTVALPVSAIRAEPEPANVTELLALLQSLMKQVEELQKQLDSVKSEIREEIKAGLKEGMEDEDIKKIQELLATDSEIYPKGITSGYFGPLTKEALKRFQLKHELAVTGEMTEETRELMKEYFKERSNGKFPPGLLKAPGIHKKMLERLKMKDGEVYLDCTDKKAAGPLCKKRDEEKKDESDKIISTSTVEEAIEEAEVEISDLDLAIKQVSASSTASTTVVKVKEAEKSLSMAKKALELAKNYLTEGNLKLAYEKARYAEKVADEAQHRLMNKKSTNDDDEEDDDDDVN